MKKFIKILILFFSINTSLLAINEKATAQTVNFQVFYDDLSPHGNWIESPEYGYVWSPRVAGFAPYSTGGYWVLTDYGWTWASDYSWGWAPFHYGRWYYDAMYGYVWVPGYEWGPGWVTWRRSNDYYGWAPIGPGVNISLAYSNSYNIPYNRWSFVRCNDFGRRDIHNYYINRSKNVTIINNTTVINTTKVDNTRKTTFTPGPDRMEVEKRAGRKIDQVAIVDEKKPAQRVTKNSVQLYRPVIEDRANDNNAGKPAPAKVTTANEMKTQGNAKQRKVKDNRDQKTETNPQGNDIKQPQVREPARENNPVRNDNNNQPVKQQPVREQPKRKPIRDDQPAQVKPQREIQQPAQQRNNNERKIEPVQRTQPERNVDQPVQRPQQRNVEPQRPPKQERRVQPPTPQPQREINRQPERTVQPSQPMRQPTMQRPPAGEPRRRPN